MDVKIIDYQDQWQHVKDRAMNTVGKEDGRYPSSAWKRKILLAEHSPIRLITLTLRFSDIPYFVVMHLVRHHEGCNHFVSTQRSDRTGIDRSQLPQGNLVDYTLVANAQALINISRKRLCSQADPETRKAWKMAVDAIREVEPELASVCCPECVFRGFCPELKTCGYCTNSMRYADERMRYILGKG